MRLNYYQLSLIFLGVLVSALFGAFLYREVFPEYKNYQNRYWALEEFRSSYTGESPPPFEFGIKQILIDEGGAAEPAIDRCTSCHVAVQFSHFSPTKIAYDINGEMVLDASGEPVKEPNEEYIWKKLDEKIASLLETGNESEAAKLQELKTVRLGEHTYDVTKALQMHPLIGRETRPFEYHPIDEFGCTSCHSGNGRALTAERAHGPVYDGTYEEEFMGPVPQFTEPDPENDPLFAKVFNHKPGHKLLFQTTPIFVGSLMQAKCVECHQTSEGALLSAEQDIENLIDAEREKVKAKKTAFTNEKKALETLLVLKRSLAKIGYQQTIDQVRVYSEDQSLPLDEQQSYRAQLQFLLKTAEEDTVPRINDKILSILGSKRLTKKVEESSGDLDQFIEENKGNPGSLFKKAEAADSEKDVSFYVAEAKKLTGDISSQIDSLVTDYHRGKELYLSQACYTCHRIEGLARGGVGPELSDAGTRYPWFLKESIVWPQADLHTSTMPNFKLDHEEVEDLMTFLLSQNGRNRANSETGYQTKIMEWEAGKKLPWEKPVPSEKIRDVRYGMSIFATEGCAACHRLKGFESNVGYQSEKISNDFNIRFRDSEWFKELIPEEAIGSEIVAALESRGGEIDQRIVDGVREGSILEDLEEKNPELIESFYSNFKYAMRAKNSAYANEPEKLAEWKDRVRRVLMVYVQEYGLGRLIGPRPNWSGVYRSDEWLIEHFRKPSRHIARSIMPVFPFDDTKFYALTYMLDVLGIKNRNSVREIWDNRGFDPEMAYEIFCSQCHGEFLHGNGPVAEWIYPIPKNLRNATFLRNFTEKNVINSIVHGVNGTPMPPWGEVATDKPMTDGVPVITENEIQQLVDWLFSSLLGGEVIKGEEDVPKWQYTPEDVMEELKKEGDHLLPGPSPQFLDLREPNPELSVLTHPEVSSYYASLTPVVTPPGSEIFDLTEQGYRIKDKYYTRENIEAGQAFFELNCSVCHGIEADGSGYRAGTMYDAKPRMLTNFHWIETRDDLRLLSSIKYGVAGTSMTQWGDMTSSLQRLQLVMYIRSLSREQEKRDKLFNSLYRAFDQVDQLIEQARVDADPKQGEKLTQLKALVVREKELYQILGVQIIRSDLSGGIFQGYLSALSLNEGTYQVKDGKLVAQFDASGKREKMHEQLLRIINQHIEKGEQRKVLLEGKIPSNEVRKEMEELNGKINAIKTIRDDMIFTFSEAKRLRERQSKIYSEYLGK